LCGDQMVELSDSTIRARGRLADELARVIRADARVRRWRRLEFAEDGGVVLVVELCADLGSTSREVIAREVEFAAATAVPKVPWVRVQVA